jgi:uncharacterized protein (UPF0276 family)
MELTAEHFYDAPQSALRSTDRLPVYVHGLGLSLGSPGPIDIPNLNNFARVVEHVRPAWVSEHVSYTRCNGIDLGHLNPVPRTRDMVRVIGDHAKRMADRCQRPVLLENITAQLDPGGELSEPDFLNQACKAGRCGLLLDVTNLFINSRNHGYDPVCWLDQLDRDQVRQLHVVGYGREQGRWVDHHAAPLQGDLLDLVAIVLQSAPVEAVILERDGRLSELAEIESDLARLAALCERISRTEVMA